MPTISKGDEAFSMPIPVQPDDTAVLGRQVAIPADPQSFGLHVVPNQDADVVFFPRFTIPEFTSLCPVTGQPDFALIIIDYIPKDYLIESKSLKLYMHSFRNHKGFHERVTNMIARKIFDAALPHWLQVTSYFNPRGGIPIDVCVRLGTLLPGLRLEDVPPHNVGLYKGR